MGKEDDFYNNYNLVNEEDIEKAKKKSKRKKPIQMSHIKKGSSYESVSINKEVIKEEILEEEPVVEKQEETFLVEYEIVDEKKEEPKEILPKVYVGYTPRLVISIILVLVLSVLSIMLLYHAFTVDELVNIRYTEDGNIDYEIKENIIDLDINYQYKINYESNLIFNYQVLRSLIIEEKDNPDNIFYQDNYELTKPKEATIVGKKSNDTEKINIDISEYKNKVNKFTESYEVETESYLDIYLLTKYHSTPSNDFFIQDESTTKIRIPLLNPSTPEIDNLKVEKRVNKKPTIKLQSSGLLGLGVLIGIGAIFSLSQAILLIYSIVDQKSTYDKTINYILKKYKKRLQEVKKTPRKTGKQVTNVKNIKELVKISKKLNQPIYYCMIHNHSKSQFYVPYNKELYIYTLKEVDLEKKRLTIC